jgi:hypothetical protein
MEIDCEELRSRKKWGFLGLKDDKLRGGLKCVGQLLHDAVLEYAKFNYRYCEHSRIDSEFPFGWGELQNQAIWVCSFHRALIKRQYKELIIPEYAYTRKYYQDKNREQWKRNRIDIWIPLIRGKEKKEKVLLIEYKHEYHVWANEKVKPFSFYDWTKLCKATNGRRKQEKFRLHKVTNSEIVKVALMTIVIYVESKSKHEKGIELAKNDFVRQIGQTIKSEPEANWSAWWWLPFKRQKEPNEWRDRGGATKYWYYKGLYFLARVERARKFE